MEHRTLPRWDEDDTDDIWFVVAHTQHGTTDFALVSRAHDGDTPLDRWNVLYVTSDGGFSYGDQRTFDTLQEAKDFVELTYALES